MEPKRSLGEETASARVLWDAKIKKPYSLGESAHACHEKSIALYKCPDFDVADLLGHESEWPYCFMLFSV